MEWRKTIYGSSSLEGLTMISLLFLLFSFYQQTIWLMYIGALVLVISLASQYYLKHVADELVFSNDKQVIRLSIGEETILHLKISQHSRLPIFKANLRIRLDGVVEGINLPTYEGESGIEYHIPIFLRGRETIQIPLPLIAMHRGATRIKSLELEISNFFGIGSIGLEYLPYIYKELIIHPTPITVPQTDRLIATKNMGEYPTPSSTNENLLAPIGTRDYVYSDPYSRIHWKASAKTQKLQTKIYEKTAHYSWTFIINLREPNTPNYQLGVVENIEAIVSNVAYMAMIATKKGIEFELFLNLRMASHIAVYHLPIGGGKQQLGSLLDALARIHHNGNTLQESKLLHFVEKQQQNSPVVIACGPYGEEGYRYFSHLQRKGQKVYMLHDDDHSPAIVPLGSFARKGEGE